MWGLSGLSPSPHPSPAGRGRASCRLAPIRRLGGARPPCHRQALFMTSPRPRLTHFTTNRPVAVLMVFLSAVVFGFFSFKRLPVNLMPELNYPTLTVRTEYPGAAPEEVENEISRPIEE